jgi:hypothetical protein
LRQCFAASDATSQFCSASGAFQTNAAWISKVANKVADATNHAQASTDLG